MLLIVDACRTVIGKTEVKGTLEDLEEDASTAL
jgi:hypothetical protein